MKSLILLFGLFLIFTNTKGQTTKSVNSFPEDYSGKTITFSDIKILPMLNEIHGYYSVRIDLGKSPYDDDEWVFGAFDKIYGVVQKEIAKQMINNEIGGSSQNLYYGTITGKVIKSDVIFGFDYLFVISKINIHPPFKDSPSIIFEQK